MTATEQTATLSVLPKADGSATYSCGGYTVTGSVNGPVEASRRDEHPYEAHVDVVVRPAAGVGGIRERHLEGLLESTLSQIILVKNFPRLLIQIVLQIEASPTNDYVNTKLVQAGINLPAIPALLQTAVLALLSASVPMTATAMSTAVAVLGTASAKNLILNPSPRDLTAAESVHVFAFSSDRGLLLAESQGDFSMDEWDDACKMARRVCCEIETGRNTGLDLILDDNERSDPDMGALLRSTVDAKVAADLHWR